MSTTNGQTGEPLDEATAPDLANEAARKLSPLDIIDAARPTEAIIPLCLRTDLVAEHEKLDRELRALENKADSNDTRLVGDLPRRRLAERIEALQDEMTEGTVEFRFRALNRTRYRDLLGEHPPRKGDDESARLDRTVGFNRNTFYEAVTRAALVDPVLDDTRWTHLVETISAGQFQELVSAANELCTDSVTVPFSGAASRTLRPSKEN